VRSEKRRWGSREKKKGGKEIAYRNRKGGFRGASEVKEAKTQGKRKRSQPVLKTGEGRARKAEIWDKPENNGRLIGRKIRGRPQGTAHLIREEKGEKKGRGCPSGLPDEVALGCSRKKARNSHRPRFRKRDDELAAQETYSSFGHKKKKGGKEKMSKRKPYNKAVGEPKSRMGGDRRKKIRESTIEKGGGSFVFFGLSFNGRKEKNAT